ncbi:hypothetical protein, partial [Pseudomonas sp.]|uniref:hypothetical protein n=1 Tax=Pseudomonas sp. TaxID=306 RepID=UPI00272B8359
MFNPANEAHFSLTLDGIEYDLKVLSFTAREAISQPYVVELQLVSDQANIDLEALMHKSAYLDLGN